MKRIIFSLMDPGCVVVRDCSTLRFHLHLTLLLTRLARPTLSIGVVKSLFIGETVADPSTTPIVRCAVKFRSFR
jgi:hypothetical protein